jgi:MFS family permease
VLRIAQPWRVVACAFLIALWGWGLGFYGLGVYLVGLREVHGWSASVVSGAITTYYLVGAALIALVGRAVQRVGPRPVVLTGLGCMALAVSALTVVSRPWQLYPAFALMALGWATMSAAMVNVLVAPWFQARRGLALSWAFTGASTSGVVLGPALLWTVQWLGFAAGLRVAAVALVAVLAPVVWLVLRRPGPAAPSPGPGRPAPAGASPLREGAYWTIQIPFAAALVAQVGFITHQIAFLSPMIGAAAAGLCVSLVGLAAVAGRFALGLMADRGDARVAAALNALVQVAGFALLLWAPSATALYAGCLLFGLGVGSVVSLPGLLVGRDFPAARFAGVISLVTATNQVAFAFAPTLFGVLRDRTGSYTAALVLCIGLDLLAAAVVVAGRRPARPRAVSARDALEVSGMLQLRPNCECCDRNLPPDSREALICSFECTFCRTCTETILGGRCPNCGGELVRRPVRPPDKLGRFPPSGERVFKPEGCRRVAEAGAPR